VLVQLQCRWRWLQGNRSTPEFIPSQRLNSAARDGGRTIDGTNTRWRLGIAPCLEVLVDVPNYLASVKAPGVAGRTGVAPAVQWQIPH
jgi:hypothetical protein